MAELTDLRTGDRSTRTIAIESEDPARVIAAVRDLGLGSRPNVSVPQGAQGARLSMANDRTHRRLARVLPVVGWLPGYERRGCAAI